VSVVDMFQNHAYPNMNVIALYVWDLLWP